jgi:3-oxosteroid 1-dehydrogenase
LPTNHISRGWCQRCHFDPATHCYPNLPCYLIFDQNYAATYSFAGRSTGAEIPGWVTQAEDPRALGAKLGINTDSLAATIGRFNDSCRTGTHNDFRRGELAWRLAQDRAIPSGQNPSLGPLDKPPFYGIELGPAGGSSAGVLTDENAQVLHSRGKPIPGFYATGNTAAKVEFGAGYQAGLAGLGNDLCLPRGRSHAQSVNADQPGHLDFSLATDRSQLEIERAASR